MNERGLLRSYETRPGVAGLVGKRAVEGLGERGGRVSRGSLRPLLQMHHDGRARQRQGVKELAGHLVLCEFVSV